MTNSNRKGKDGEQELAQRLRDLFKVECYRSQQYCGADGDGDVKGLPGVHVECKRTEKFRMYLAMQQATRDAKSGDVPMVCHRPSRQEWVAIVYLDDLPKLVEQLYLTLYSGGLEDGDTGTSDT